ncbi:cytochrome d ubiquinol oxidase subunit II [Peribacillus sp. YIM B13481]|uniref:cytochrome d ubiquinol oxidase subunit II n=1 Tax=Peribacillus sp. YIM B13481 TaxID=3366299 RepID=UPI00366AA3FE
MDWVHGSDWTSPWILALAFGQTYIKKEETNAKKIANSYLSPTWEVTNTFVVGLVIAICSLFPDAVFPIGEALIVPASLILVLLCIMSAFLVFSHSLDKNENFSKQGGMGCRAAPL